MAETIIYIYKMCISEWNVLMIRHNIRENVFMDKLKILLVIFCNMLKKVHFMVFWVMTLCSDVVGYQHFGGHFTLKMEAAWPSRMFASYPITSWFHNPENHDMNLQCCENEESCVLKKGSENAFCEADTGKTGQLSLGVFLHRGQNQTC
jgi:hypothetical protein